MANITITKVDLSKIVLSDSKYQDDELTFSTAETMNVGTILARDSSSLKLVPFVKGVAPTKTEFQRQC